MTIIGRLEFIRWLGADEPLGDALADGSDEGLGEQLGLFRTQLS
jgi:hypothetical protein